MVDDWRETVYSDGRLCGACAHAGLLAWIQGRDEKPLPLLVCPAVPSPLFPCEGNRCPLFRRWRREGDMGVSGGVMNKPEKTGEPENDRS
jgi:hypothetical protein